jgi:probable HAF family extracellular repeat protein
LFFLFVALTFAPLALAQGSYTVIDYPGALQTQTWGVNSAGDISGLYEDTNFKLHGFLLNHGKYITIDYPGGQFTYCYGLNDVGQLVGISDGGGFLYDVRSQTFTQVSYPGAASTDAVSVNNAGTVVGYFYYAGNPQAQGFQFDGSAYELIEPPGALYTLVYGVTGAGELVGYAGHDLTTFNNFSFDGTSFKSVRIPHARNAYLLGISNSGKAFVGFEGGSAGGTGAFFLQNNAMRVLQIGPTLYTVATGVNDLGKVVGAYSDASYNIHGFLWTPSAGPR